MFESAEIEKWNNTFVDGKIEENDLKHPTELFVTRILVAYLRKFGYKVEPPFSLIVDSENTREKCLFLVRLTKKIDRILKTTDKSYTFSYLDIVRPVPKRTTRMLLILLNYYHYYEMFIGDVCKIEQNALEKREELKRNIERLRRSNAEQKDSAMQMEDELAKLSKILPATNAEITKYKNNIEHNQVAVSQIASEIQLLQQKYSDLQARESALISQIVNEDDISSLKTELKDLQNNIAELDSLERNKQAGSNDRIERLLTSEQVFKRVEEIKNLLPAEQIESYKTTIKKLKEIKTQHGKIQHEVETLQNALEKLNIDTTTAMEEFKTKKPNLAQEKRLLQRMLAENQNYLFKDQNELISLKNQVKNVDSLLDEQLEIKEYMLKSIEGIMASYKNVKI